MSEQTIEVKHVVVHILDKQQNGDASERLSPEEGLVTEASQRLINDICAKYAGRTGKVMAILKAIRITILWNEWLGTFSKVLMISTKVPAE